MYEADFHRRNERTANDVNAASGSEEEEEEDYEYEWYHLNKEPWLLWPAPLRPKSEPFYCPIEEFPNPEDSLMQFEDRVKGIKSFVRRGLQNGSLLADNEANQKLNAFEEMKDNLEKYRTMVVMCKLERLTKAIDQRFRLLEDCVCKDNGNHSRDQQQEGNTT